MRVLAVKRISRDTESSDALTAQGERLERGIRDGGHVAVGIVEDATVSGAINLDDRPSLGQWMRSPQWEQWDAIMVTTLDRITRNQFHWELFAERCHQGGKEIICLDDPGLDIHTSQGRLIAYVKASQAQQYRDVIVQKRRDQTQSFRDQDLWPGGLWPFGYRAMTVMVDGKRRKRLFLDPVTSKLIREAYDRIVNQAHTVTDVARDWNARGVMTAKDYQAHVNASEGRDEKMTEIKGFQWSHASLKIVLSKPALMGYATHKGEVRMRDGLPVQWSEPILSPAEFEKLQERMSVRSISPSNKPVPNPLREVLWCPCGQHMNSDSSESKTGKRYRYFRCRTFSTYKRCRYRVSWPVDIAHEFLTEEFMVQLGDKEMTTKEFIPGKDNRTEIKNLRTAIGNLAATLGQFEPGSIAHTQTVETMKRHEANLKTLEAEPVVEAAWKVSGTGETYGEWWSRETDWYARGDMLRKAGIRVYLGGSPKNPTVPIIHTFIPHDLEARAGDVISGMIEPGFLEQANEDARESALMMSRPLWDRFWDDREVS
ncbi:recombinase family protein [Streptomyces sp. NRRL B-1347]|uniref:recombinase family protein n=1 Tax=Streptomyces sp. NRRL B-1347 TaxID=1476877 RepID=UPI0004C589E8|nr:recombinase family protein [Streptomyces sp. NRRL B-1347]